MPQVKIRTFARMREILGGKEIEFTISLNETIGTLIEKLVKTYGRSFENQIKDRVTGTLIPVLIMINDKVYRSVVDMGERVSDGDTVTILIPFDGGESLS
jgi:MoaD family protein